MQVPLCLGPSEDFLVNAFTLMDFFVKAILIVLSFSLELGLLFLKASNKTSTPAAWVRLLQLRVLRFGFL